MIVTNKVFGIGFQKTATSSLAAALYMLGYNVTGYFGIHDPDISETVYDQAFDLADRYDAAQDTPWPVLYKELDEKYPGSKFILTVRPTEKWIKSVVKHFKHYRIPAHEWIYGVPRAWGHEDVYMRRYEEHNRDVIEYFQDRPNDLLVIDITAGDGWEKICPFLGVEVPPVKFPVQNTAKEKKNQIIQRSVRFLKNRIATYFGHEQEDIMKEGVSAAFIRDILHYHLSMYENLWEKIEELSDAQFAEKGPTGSICEILQSQILEDEVWLSRLTGKQGELKARTTRPVHSTKQSLYESWKNNHILLREYAANLTDAGCNDRVSPGNDCVWEIFIHLMNYGIEKRYEIRQILSDFDILVPEESFIRFFRKNL